MKKKSIRCFKEYANVYPNLYNYEVYFPLLAGWSSFSFVTCINCGEIFVIDWENPITKGMSINEIAGNKCCPTCEADLKTTLKNYPKYIKLPNGNIGSYTSNNFSFNVEESIVLDFFEIKPPSSTG